MLTKQHRDVPMAALSPLMEEVLARGASVELTVTGNSMYPMLRHRVSRARLAPAISLQVGDIPFYRRENGAYVLHRIVAVEHGTYTCCGDNQWVLEPGVRPDQIIAVMTHFARKKRWTSCENVWYHAYWLLWVKIRPLRRLIFGGFRRVKRKVGQLLRVGG